MTKRGSAYSLEKADLRPGDFGLRANARQMFGNYVELSTDGGSADLKNVRQSASLIETPVYAEPKLWRIDLQFSAPRATPPVDLSPWLPQAAGASVVVTVRAALDRDKRVSQTYETIVPLNSAGALNTFPRRFQAAHQLGISVAPFGESDGVVGCEASVVEVQGDARDAFGSAALAVFPQSAVSAVFLEPNARRRQFFVQNWGSSALFVAFEPLSIGPGGGGPAWTIGLPNRGDIYESPRDCWQGYVSGIWAAAGGVGDMAAVTEAY